RQQFLGQWLSKRRQLLVGYWRDRQLQWSKPRCMPKPGRNRGPTLHHWANICRNRHRPTSPDEALCPTRNRVSSICTNFDYITKLGQIYDNQNRPTSRVQCFQPYPLKYPPEREDNCNECKACNPARC